MALLWLVAFAWTLAFELPVYTLVLHRHVRRWWTPIAITLGVNLATHPAFWFVFPRFEPYWQYVVAGEACVVITEIVLVALVTRRLALAVVAGLAANLVSTLLGLVLMPLLLG